MPVSQLSFAPVKVISEYFKVGDSLPLKVVEFDKESKKIVLSVVEALRKKDDAFVAAYNAAHPVPNADKASPADVTYDSSQADFFNEEYNPDYKAIKMKNEELKAMALGLDMVPVSSHTDNKVEEKDANTDTNNENTQE